MFKKTLFAAAALSAAFITTGITTQPAEAAIKCVGPSQVNPYGLIRTPYCEDNYLARIAGMNPYKVRRNPHAKQHACKLVGHDPRVSDICHGHGFDLYGDRR